MNYLSISIKNDQLIAALGSEQWIFSLISQMKI